jgi:hypothetical protein
VQARAAAANFAFERVLEAFAVFEIVSHWFVFIPFSRRIRRAVTNSSEDGCNNSECVSTNHSLLQNVAVRKPRNSGEFRGFSPKLS